MSKLRLLYTSNAFWAASGYGVQGKSLLPRLAELPEFGGRDAIANFAWYGLQGGAHQVDGFKVYPGVNDPYGNDVIGAHTRNFGANVVISLIDVWVLHGTKEKIAPALFLPWLPIDHDPIPDRVLESLKGAYLPLTYARWGQKLLAQAGVHNRYIPHGIETGVFKLLPDDDRLAEFKAGVTGTKDSHLTVMVAANKGYPDRKAFQVQIRAWAAFAKDKPHARLYIHADPTTVHGGLDLIQLIKRLGTAPGSVIFPDRYGYAMGFPADHLTVMYNAADVYLGASMSEGFGIPIIEAQACGCPVVVTDFSAMPELVRWGYAVPPLDVFWTPMGSWQAWPDHAGITAALDNLHTLWLEEDRGHSATWRAAQTEMQNAIHAEYDWDTIVREQWQPLIAELAEAAPSLERLFPVNGHVPNVPPPPVVTQPTIKPRSAPLKRLGVTKVEVTG